MIQYHASAPPGILPGFPTPPGPRRDAGSSPRFVMQSHALGTPKVSPRALFIAATIAFALYLIGCRLSD